MKEREREREREKEKERKREREKEMGRHGDGEREGETERRGGTERKREGEITFCLAAMITMSFSPRWLEPFLKGALNSNYQNIEQDNHALK